LYLNYFLKKSFRVGYADVKTDASSSICDQAVSTRGWLSLKKFSIRIVSLEYHHFIFPAKTTNFINVPLSQRYRTAITPLNSGSRPSGVAERGVAAMLYRYSSNILGLHTLILRSSPVLCFCISWPNKKNLNFTQSTVHLWFVIKCSINWFQLFIHFSLRFATAWTRINRHYVNSSSLIKWYLPFLALYKRFTLFW
jgi:hypothetical protein